MVTAILDAGLDALPPRRADILKKPVLTDVGDAVISSSASVRNRLAFQRGARFLGRACRKSFQRVTDDLLQAGGSPARPGAQTGSQRVGAFISLAVGARLLIEYPRMR